jgi:uncharacterized membrane protein YoaK (UPF0700 family)
MIYGSPSISTYTRPNMAIWMILAFQAGLLNTGGFMACHSFVSHVTGFATLFGIELGQQNHAVATALILAPGCFLLGAMISGFLVDIRLKLGKEPRYYIVFGVLFLLIFAVEIGGFNKTFGTFGEISYPLLALLCLICGLQNATVSLVSKSVVRTTHLTGITTDLGIGLVRSLYKQWLGLEYGDEGKANLMRIGIIVFFTLGAVAGYRLFHSWEFRAFLFPTLISGGLFFTTFYFQVLRGKT